MRDASVLLGGIGNAAVRGAPQSGSLGAPPCSEQTDQPHALPIARSEHMPRVVQGTFTALQAMEALAAHNDLGLYHFSSSQKKGADARAGGRLMMRDET